MGTKVLVLGIDAASPSLLSRWATEDKLPVIRSLMDRGTSGAIRGLDGLFVGSTWPSLYTGLGPASHGFYRITQLKSGSYGFYRPLTTVRGVAGTPFWRLASDAGRRVGVMDVPLSRPERGLNGFQVVEWGSHDAVFGFKTSSPDIANRVVATAGQYPLPTNCAALRRTPEDFEPFVSGLESAARLKGALTAELLANEDWDLFVQVFTESHCAGHRCWHIHDSTHPSHDPRLPEALGDPLERVYRAIDAAIGEILDRAGDADVLVFSSHGMAPYRGAQFLLPEILFRLGATDRPPGPPPARRAGTSGARPAPMPLRVVSRLARRASRPLRALRSRRGLGTDDMHRLGADPRTSRCFAVPNGAPVGGIRLNLAGREPQGVLKPGREADAFCDELIGDLRAIVDERTGRPLIAAVHRTDDLYAGARRDALPDLLVEWNAEPATGNADLAAGNGATVRATSAKIGTVEGVNRSGRTGEHEPGGMFVAAGNGIAAIEREAPVSLTDLHPTICRRLDLPASDVDGVPIPELTRSRSPA